MALTAKQSIFVCEYLIDLNATQAAIRAGYSKKTAKSQGQRLLTNEDVRRQIDLLIAKRVERTQIDADWVLKRLTAEAEADIAELYDDNGTIKKAKDWPEIWRKGLVSGVDTTITENGTITKLRLSDRIKRIELIGRHTDVQAFRDNIQHSGTTTFIIEK